MLINLPIYYTVERKTKADTVHLVGDNWVRNLQFHLKNKVKQHYHSLVKTAIPSIPNVPYQTFNLSMVLFYKNPSTDPSNVFHQIEKYTLDALQELNIITNDNVKYHLGTITSIGGIDKVNPRCEVTIIPITKDLNETTN